MPTRNIRIIWCAAVLSTSACGTPPPRSQTQNCEVVAHSPSNQYELGYQLLLPAPCPVPLARIGEEKRASGRIYDNGLPDFEFAELLVSNSQGVVQSGNIETFSVINNVRSANPQLTYKAATGATIITDRVPTNAYDYGRFQAFARGQSKNPGNPHGTVEISYEKSAVQVSLGGPEIPPVNTTQTWYAIPRDGIDPYQYRWYRDGVAVGTGVSYSANTGSAPFGLRVEVNDANTAYAATVLAVDVGGIRATITGPGLVYSSQNGGTWQVSGAGGQQPYTFQWYIDGSYVADGPSLSGYPGENGHTLHVKMRDAVGATHSSSFNVVGVGAGDGTCEPLPPAVTC